MRPPFDSYISSLIQSDARPCIPLAGMWYAALLRLHPRHEHHHHLHRSDRGNDGAEHIGRATDRLGRIVAGRAVHHRRDRLRALYHGRHWRDDDRPSTARCSSVALALTAHSTRSIPSTWALG